MLHTDELERQRAIGEFLECTKRGFRRHAQISQRAGLTGRATEPALPLVLELDIDRDVSRRRASERELAKAQSLPSNGALGAWLGCSARVGPGKRHELAR